MVVADQALFRSGLVRLLEDDDRLEVVGARSGRPEPFEHVDGLDVDVLVADLQLSSGDGVELTRWVAAVSPRTRILVLAAVADSRVISALVSGAAGFMAKDDPPEAIRAAVVLVHLGDHALSRDAMAWLVGAAGSHGGPAPGGLLTRREAEVLRLVAAGTVNRDIAQALHVSEKTVRNYVSRLYHKLDLHNRAQLALYAIDTGITHVAPRPSGGTTSTGQETS
jgi:DNA-binding NarL/FixJ family response regulator